MKKIHTFMQQQERYIYIFTKRFKFDEEIFNEWQSSGIGFEDSNIIPQHHDQEEYLCGVFLTKNVRYAVWDIILNRITA